MACRQISLVHQRSGRRAVLASGTGRVCLYSQRCQNRPLDLFRPSLPTPLERSCGQPSGRCSLSPLLVRRAALFDRYFLYIESRLYFCARHFVCNRQMFTFSRAHQHALTIATRRHEYSRGLEKKFWCHRFGGIWPFWL